MPNVPTDKIMVIDLNVAFADYTMLYKGLAYELGRDIITHNPHQQHNPTNSTNPTLKSSTGSNKNSGVQI